MTAMTGAVHPLATATDRVRAVAILTVVDELRRRGALEQIPDPRLGAYWTAPAPHQGIGFCDLTLRAAWRRGLLVLSAASPAAAAADGRVKDWGEDPQPGQRRRVTLKSEDEIAAAVAQLEQEYAADKAAARARGEFVAE